MYVDHRVSGVGAPVLLVHGAAEDAELLQPQADAFAVRGHRVITYDRRGTGRSTRAGWPHGGVARHVADAAQLLEHAAGGPARVLGLSSGGIVAFALAEAHPDLVSEVIAWEPPALALLPDGLVLHAELIKPIEQYLHDHPDDWSGAFDVQLMIMSGGAADLQDPLVQRMRRNAEAAVRDDAPIITAHRLNPRPGAARVTVATGESPDPLLGQIAEVCSERYGTTVHRVTGADDHEIYLSRPEVLAEVFASASAAAFTATPARALT